MAIHFPKKFSVQERFDAWVAGICPYCGNSHVQETSIKNGRCFKCQDCNVTNKFTLPRLIEEKQK